MKSNSRKITGGMIWYEDEYPYPRDIPPEEFPDWLVAVAELVEETIRTPSTSPPGLLETDEVEVVDE